MLPLLAQIGKRVWMPDEASTYSSEIDWVFYFIYWSSAIATVLIVAAMILMVIKYRRRPGHKAQPSPAHSTALELTWTLVPSVVFVLIFYWGFKGFMDIATTPDYAYEINVTGFQWGWNFQYPNGATSDILYLPKDRPVRLILQSNDVIHSIFVPAFRMKKDIVPGRYNSIWVEPTKLGEFELYCAEYCGQSHSKMITTAVVLDQGSFEKWVIEAGVWIEKVPPVEAGKLLYERKGCKQCHSIDGSPSTGPTFKDIFRKAGRDTVAGKRIVADENYIRDSILVPSQDIVAGFKDEMSKIQVSDQEITAIIEWMKSLDTTGDAAKPMEAWPVKEGAEGADAPAASSDNADTTNANAPSDAKASDNTQVPATK